MTRHATLCKYGEKPKEELDPIQFPLLLCFTRHLIRHTVSHDALVLAMGAAQAEMQVTADQMKELMRAVLHERDANGIWPKGF